MVGESYGYPVQYLEDVRGFKVKCGFESQTEVREEGGGEGVCWVFRHSKGLPQCVEERFVV